MNGLFDLSHFTPHGFCLAWEPGLIWVLAGSDLLIATAYFSIPAALLVFLRRRRDLAFKPVFGLFAAFILACGTTHVMGALTLWVPAYWLEAWVNLATAALSVATAVTLWPLLPKALALPSPEALKNLNDALTGETHRLAEAGAMLRQSEARQQLLYARTPAALHATDADGVLIDVSDRWLQLAGYQRDEVIGRHLAAIYTPQSASAMMAQLAGFQDGADPHPAELQLQRRDGTVRDVEIVLELERDESGRLLRVMAAVTDVTSRKEAEAALGAAEDRLRQAQKMEAVGQLTGGIAHDFNNLLTTIMGSIELLQKRSTLDERGLRLAANALEGSRRAARLTSQLLSFSRRQRLAPEPLLPGDIIEGINELLARTLGDSITLGLSLPAEPWLLMADRNQIEGALLNLVINARDAIEGADPEGERSGGHVQISVSNRVVGAGDFAADDPDRVAPGDYVSISVIDTGCGMTDEVKLRAVEPFFTTKEAGAGTGLGLSQIYGFVTQSGGALRLRSAPGRGTAIDMLLPRAQAAQAQRPNMPPPVTARDGDGQHILLVEDDALLRQTMSDALRGRGYRVTEAADGPAALNLLDSPEQDPEFELLFTDVVMPGGLSGVDLAVQVRQRRASLPVLFASGYSADSVLAAWPEPVDILPKPYSPEDVAARIAAKLNLPVQG